MSVELPASVEVQLKNLAAAQGRDVKLLVEEAIRLYLEWAAITDLVPSDVAATQDVLTGDLRDISAWKAGGE